MIVPIPLKTVVGYYFLLDPTSFQETPPTGWAWANGQTLTNPNSSDQATWVTDIVGQNQSWITPDLRNRFILGANPAQGTTTMTSTYTGGGSTISATTPSTLFPSSGTLSIRQTDGKLIEGIVYTGTSGTQFTGVDSSAATIFDPSGGTKVALSTTVVTTAGVIHFAGKAATDVNVGTNANAPGIMARGGSHQTTLVANDLPAHSHTQSSQTGTTTSILDSGGSAIDLAHTHTVDTPSHSHGTVTNSQDHFHNYQGGVGQWTSLSTGVPAPNFNFVSYHFQYAFTPSNTDSGTGGHTHTISASGSHNHGGTLLGGGGHDHGSPFTPTSLTTPNVTATGGGSPHENRPSYYGLVYIVKVRF